MVRLTPILRWSDYFHMPKRYIERAKFNGTVIGNLFCLNEKSDLIGKEDLIRDVLLKNATHLFFCISRGQYECYTT